MRLIKAHIRDFRSIVDSGVFEIEKIKTIFVGSNEAGKSAILLALQHLNRPKQAQPIQTLRDFPRSRYHLIREKKVDPTKTPVVTGWFALEAADLDGLGEEYRSVKAYSRTRYAADNWSHHIEGEPPIPSVGGIKKDVARLVAHVRRAVKDESGQESAPGEPPAAQLEALIGKWSDQTLFYRKDESEPLRQALEKCLPFVAEGNEAEETRYDRLVAVSEFYKARDAAYTHLAGRCPTFVLFNNYFRVRPRIQLDHLAARVEQNLLDDESYDYGNLCLLKLLGFTPRELANLASAAAPPADDPAAVKKYQEMIDERQYQLNAASLRLTKQIVEIWAPDQTRGEAARVRISADGQYLKLVVEDSVGVEVELDQRSEGFQWLVSFFVVFFAESAEKHSNAILLLDEPGVSLHGLKQREFRTTLTKLAEQNQTLYTTHSPFLVGPDELDIVRVVEMKDRLVGTKVSQTVAASDSPALLPLQEALGYDMAQSLFAQQKNLVVEGLTDYWYVEAMHQLFLDGGEKSLDDKVALVPAGNAGKVVYFATILHAHKLKVAALLDSDAAGDQAAKQESLIHTMGQKAILRTRDFYSGPATKVEVEDMLRATLIGVAKADLGWDIAAEADKSPTAAIVSVFERVIPEFSKYKLAKAFLRWARTAQLSTLVDQERADWAKLFAHTNKVLK